MPGCLEQLTTATAACPYARPSFLILGAQKAGTSALHSYLSAHPQIVPAREKEVCYFDQDCLYELGTEWYLRHFPLLADLGTNKVTFESTPEYICSSKAPARIFAFDRHMKLIVLLRNPVARAYSAWNMFRTLIESQPEYLRSLLPTCDPPLQEWFDAILSSDLFPDFAKAVAEEIERIASGSTTVYPDFVRRGFYYDQLLRYFDYFDRSQFAIIHSEDLRAHTNEVLSTLSSFLGLPLHAWDRTEPLLIHVGQYQDQLTSDTRALLRDFYGPHNERLYSMLGRDLAW